MGLKEVMMEIKKITLRKLAEKGQMTPEAIEAVLGKSWEQNADLAALVAEISQVEEPSA